MLRRDWYSLSLLHLLLLFTPILHSNATCPYELDSTSRHIPAMCYASATASSTTTGCCWFVFAAYIYAAIYHANCTGTTFLPDPTASTCATAFSTSFISRGLVRPSLLNSSDTCNLYANLAAGERPYLYPTVSAIRSATDLSNAFHLCTSSRSDLFVDQPACVDCQDAVIAATFDLLNVTNSKEFVPCGMATTIGVWSPIAPPLHRFRSYALCVLKVLKNIDSCSLGTSNLLPSPPPPSPWPSAPSASLIPTSSSSSRMSAVCGVVVGIGAGAAVVTIIVAGAAVGVAGLGGGSCCKIIFV